MTRRTNPILGLAAAAVLVLAACGDGGTSAAPATDPPASDAPASEAPTTSACAPSTDAGAVTAAMEGNAFSPSTITAAVGDVITWTNNDTVPHTATLTDDPTCTTDNLGSGESGGLTFSEAGTYAFFCKVHPDMKGTIEVS